MNGERILATGAEILVFSRQGHGPALHAYNWAGTVASWCNYGIELMLEESGNTIFIPWYNISHMRLS